MTKLTDADELLCHYTRAETAFTRILPTGQLLMNPYSKMRDPFENKEPLFLSAGATDDWEEDQRRLWAIQDQVRLSRDGYFLLSLTQVANYEGVIPDEPFRRPWVRPRMWEQYAENHEGACLVFDRAELVRTIQSNLVGRGPYWAEAVDYTVAGFGTAPGAHTSLTEFDDEEALPDGVRAHVLRHYRDFFFLKTLDWASEWEYRVVWKPSDDQQAPGPAGCFVNYGNALRWVILGENFPEQRLTDAESAAADAGVELKRMMWKMYLPYAGRVRPRG